MKTRLVIADDHEILRDALSGQSAQNAGFEVVASVGDAHSAINACARVQPDILLLDIEMPGRDALASVTDVLSVSPNTKVVILTAFCRDTFIELATRNGVSGYLLKTDPPPAIFASLQKVAEGGTAYSKAVQARMAQSDFRRTEGGPATRLADLTPRELEVLRYIGRGFDNDKMASAMFISKRTVERHVARLMDSVAIRDRAGLMKFALEHGLSV